MDDEPVEVHVTLQVFYREMGEDRVDSFMFHDFSPYFGMTDQILELFQAVEVTNVQTTHQIPINPTPAPTHAMQSHFVH